MRPGPSARRLGPIAAAVAPLALGACFLGAHVAEPGRLTAAKGCEHLVDGLRSAFVMYRVESGQTLVCNPDRAARRFVPASTYKIPHALLALEHGLVTDVRKPEPWDGRARGVQAWDRDTSLSDAITASTVWVFQGLASQIGHAREIEGVARLDYGNRDVGPPERLRSFWLSGPLAISAIEQVEFLSRLRRGALPVRADVQQQAIEMLRLHSCGAGCAVFGKSGAMLPIDDEGFLDPASPGLLPPGVERTGWWVGWVERPSSLGGPVIFAHNLDLALPGAMAARVSAARAVLLANGVDITPVD